MKVGNILGLLFAATLTVFTAHSADSGAATNRSGKISGIFEQILKTAFTNLNQPNLGTNVISSTHTNAPIAPTTHTDTTALASIPQFELSSGLKEAISTGLTRAVATLGQTNGFYTNITVKIPMPAQLANVEKMLRTVGQDGLANQFVATMNHAAEQAVPLATGIFAESLSQMTIADARDLLLSRSKTAATEYFRHTTTNQLTEKFLPIVREATEKAGATAAYKNLLTKIPFASVLTGGNSFDIDQYVTSKALDGLFTVVADEEIRIRENPQARITELLQKVFGALPQTGFGGAPTTETGSRSTTSPRYGL